MTPDVVRVADQCRAVLRLDDVHLSNEYYYAHLPLCVLDAVFSIGVTYTSTQNVVSRYCRVFGLQTVRKNREVLPPVEQQQPIRRLITLIETHGPDHFAQHVVQNRQRTSSSNGILKAEAVLLFARALVDHGANYLQDITRIAEEDGVEAQIRAIPGQRSGISFHYFLMLAGSDHLIKPDRMIRRFLSTALQRPVTADEAQSLLSAVTAYLLPTYPHLTPRLLDHSIWNYQRDH